MHGRQSIMVSTSALLGHGIMKESSTVSGLQETKDDSALMKKIPKVSQLSLMQESLVMANDMTLTDKLSFYAQSTQTLNFFVKLEVDSILNGVNSSKYWNKYAQAITTKYAKSIYYYSCNVRFSDLGPCLKNQDNLELRVGHIL